MKKASIALLMIALAGFGLAHSAEAGQGRKHQGFSITTGPDKELRDCSQVRLSVSDAEVLRSEQTKIISMSSNSPLRIQAPHHGGIFIQGWDRNEYAIKACLGAAGDSAAEAKALLDQLSLSVRDGQVRTVDRLPACASAEWSHPGPGINQRPYRPQRHIGIRPSSHHQWPHLIYWRLRRDQSACPEWPHQCVG
jgi:hypothetical protein